MNRPALCLFILIAACSVTPRWEKPGATAETAAADLELCRRSVPATRTAPPPRVPTKRGQIGGADFNTMSEHEGDRFLRDERQVGECMRDKGYIDAAND
jgi:hypothetical protein